MNKLSRREFVKTLACLVAVGEARALVESKHFFAYSLNQAFQRIKSAQTANKDFRQTDPALYYLGGITKPWSVVIDAESGDWILVGERDKKSAILTLDDLVVALRARFVHGSRDPGVTIDPRGETEAAIKQDVRFFGGIENTQFGQVCYEADWLMKKIGLKLELVPVESLRTYFDVAVEEAKRMGGRSQVSSRFWFYPALNEVNVVDGVVLLEQFQMGIFTEVLAARVNGQEVQNLAGFHHKPSQDFARSFEANYDAIAAARGVFETLRGLTRLAGLAAGLRSVTANSHLVYWLTEYPVKVVETPREVDVIQQSAEEVGLRISGGVSLAALAARLAGGDASALRELVKATRAPNEVVWEFEIEMQQGRPAGVKIPDRLADPRMILPIWTQALFLYEKRHFDAAITLLDNVVEQLPEWEHGYNVRGAAWRGAGNNERAIEDFNQALKLNSRLWEALFNRAHSYAKMLRPADAVRDYTRALEINPNILEAYLNRGLALAEQGSSEKALADYEKAIELDQRFSPAYLNRGLFHAERGKYAAALKDFDEALKWDPHLARAYLSKAMVLEEQGRAREAIDCYSRFLQYDQPLEDSPRDWKEFARNRAEGLLKDLALPPAYERSHGGVPVTERLKRIRAKTALSPAGKKEIPK